jgi:hypothetical protein
MIAPLSVAPSGLWSKRYEDLRAHALERRRNLGADPLSVALLCRRGLAGWMRGWQEMTTPRSPLPSVPCQPPFPLAPLWQEQMTLLLAQMTAQHLMVS